MKDFTPPNSYEPIPIADILEFGPDIMVFDLDFPCDDPVTSENIQGKLVLKKRPMGFVITGDISATIQMACDRCLQCLELPIRLSVEERFVLNRFVEPFDREIELGPDDFVEMVDETDLLDLKDLIRQLLLIEIPSSTYCEQCE